MLTRSKLRRIYSINNAFVQFFLRDHEANSCDPKNFEDLPFKILKQFHGNKSGIEKSFLFVWYSVSILATYFIETSAFSVVENSSWHCWHACFLPSVPRPTCSYQAVSYTFATRLLAKLHKTLIYPWNFLNWRKMVWTTNHVRKLYSVVSRTVVFKKE